MPLFYNSPPFRVTFLAKPRASAAQFNLSLDGQMMLFERADLHYLGLSNRELYFCVIDHTVVSVLIVLIYQLFADVALFAVSG